jgi:hypothetical protein
MPVISLFERLDDGSTIDEFPEWFPEMSSDQVHEVLNSAKAAITSDCRVKCVNLFGIREHPSPGDSGRVSKLQPLLSRSFSKLAFRLLFFRYFWRAS